MKCQKCGAAVPNGTLFCEECGTKVEKGKMQISISKNTIIKLIFVIVLIILAIGAINVIPKLLKRIDKTHEVLYVKNDALYSMDSKGNKKIIDENTSDVGWAAFDEEKKDLYFVKKESGNSNKSFLKVKDINGNITILDEGKDIFIKGIYNHRILYEKGNTDNTVSLYIYEKNEIQKISNSFNTLIGYNSANDKLYIVEDNLSLYEINNKLDKERIAQNVDHGWCSYREGVGLLYSSEGNIYIYNNESKAKILEKNSAVLSLENLWQDIKTAPKQNFIYFGFYNKEMNIDDFVNNDANEIIVPEEPKKEDFNSHRGLFGSARNSSNYSTALSEWQKLKNNKEDAEIAYKVLKEYINSGTRSSFEMYQDIYLYCDGKLYLICKGATTFYTKDDYCLITKNIVIDQEKIKLTDLINEAKQTAPWGTSYLEQLKKLFQSKISANKQFVYFYKGSEGTLIECDNVRHDTNSINKYTSAYLSNDTLFFNIERNLYKCKINLNNISHADIISTQKSIISSINNMIYYIDEKNDLYEYGNNSKFITDSVERIYKSMDNELYIEYDYDKNTKTFTLYKYTNKNKEKIDTDVSTFVHIDSINNKPQEINIKVNVDPKVAGVDFGEEEYINNYTKKHYKVGWFTDNNNKNEQVYYKSNFEKAINEDVFDDGFWYHFDENGHTVKNTWVGDYYYDKDGRMLTNQWIEDYYVDEDGKVLYNHWVEDYYVGVDGKKVTNQWQDNFYLGEDGKFVKNQVIDGKQVGADGKYIPPVVETTSQAANNSTSTTTAITETEKNALDETHKNDYFYLGSTKNNYTEDFDIEDAYSSKFTIMTPTIEGKESDKVAKANEFLSSAVQEIIDEAENLLNETSPAYKSITFNNFSVKTQNSSKLSIVISGSAKQKSGSTKNIKYEFIYDINDNDYTLTKK